jgi:hydrogenase nickel incorporation protein HypB
MCTTCGCGHGETRVEGEALHAHEHAHTHADGTTHSHTHDHSHNHGHGDDHDHGHQHPGQEHHGHHAHEHGHEHEHEHAHGHDTTSRTIKLEQDILSKNNAYAARNREWFTQRGIFTLNLVSSPGSGKTTLLCKTIEALKGRVGIAVIEGDQQTSHDAERIRATGAPAIQINTGKGCHLDAHMVGHALEKLPLEKGMALMIENVGNLVCPAAFDLGEAGKVVILSVTEGEDKPLKYPDMFRAARLMLVNKCDLLPHLEFDVEKAIAHARRVNPLIEVIRVSATKGEGMADWLAWIEKGAAAVRG